MAFSGTNPHARRTILAVDGNPTNLAVIDRRLTRLGYATALCDNGPDVLGRIAAHKVDLVLLDMALPGLSGLRVLQDIRANSDISDLPVIMLTGRSDPAAAVQALAGGADDHVAKPFDFDVLAARIERVLARSRRIAELKNHVDALDGQMSAMSEMKSALDETRADRQRLIASIQALNDQVERLGSPN